MTNVIRLFSGDKKPDRVQPVDLLKSGDYLSATLVLMRKDGSVERHDFKPDSLRLPASA
jgi:hypothetical protein